ncbi:MAG: divalent-cation tolerance protein CutA [Chloroflexi bacterium]|nr:divalent-cation tolerance protein CutA [Chloroflexota bacterium]
MTTTDSSEEARKIAGTVVERHLAGCVQVIGPISSTYRWEDGIETAQEWLCLIKTSAERFAELEGAILEVHSYDVPEILAVPVVAGSAAYLQWLREGLKPASRD